jgi:hypothetical protein
VDSRAKLTALASFIFASILFASITAVEMSQREAKLLKLSDDEWVKQKVAEKFSDFPVISYLGNVTTPSIDIGEGLRWTTSQGRIVEWASGQHPEYYRWFVVSQREPGDQYDPTNHRHVGFITSDLEIYDLGLDVFFQ